MILERIFIKSQGIVNPLFPLFPHIHDILKKAPLILLALDYDEAGKKENAFWMNLYPNLKPWPSRAGKSPGDSLLFKVDLQKWVADELMMNFF